MNYNQYYGPQANFMPLPNNQPYYQSPMMSPRPQTPRMGQPALMNHSPMPQAPSMAQAPSMVQAAPMPQAQPMVQAQPITQYDQNQFQYGANANINFAPPAPTQAQMSPMQFNSQNMNQGAAPQNYPTMPQSQSPYNPMQGNQVTPPQDTNVYTSANQYSGNPPGVFNTAVTPRGEFTGGNNPQNSFNAPMSVDPQQYGGGQQPQMLQVPTTQSQPAYGGEPYNIQTPQSSPLEVAHVSEPTLELRPPHKPTNVIGPYKCSDFPTLYTGAFRYSGSPAQRKPFTMRGEMARSAHPASADRRTNIGLHRYGKKWELRGGKYYGCFTSRTNGLQDTCPKAKCKLCPHDNKKR